MKNNLEKLVSFIINFKLEIILVLLIFLGILLRLESFWRYEIVSDGGLYAAGGEGLARFHEFKLIWEPDWPLMSNSITYISYLGLIYSAFGFSVGVTKIASIGMGILTLLVAFLASKNLYGTRISLIVTSIISLEPILIWSSGANFTENITLIFVILAVWSGIKAIRNDKKYLILFGLSSGLLYLSKTYVSFIFIILGLIIILILILRFKGLKMLKEKYLITGFIIFTSLVVIREYFIRTGGPLVQSNINFFSSEFIGALAIFLPIIIMLSSIYFIYWLPEIQKGFKKRDDTENLFLLLTILAFILMIWVMAALIWVSMDELFRDLVKNDARYTTILTIPILWLTFRNAEFVNNKNRKKIEVIPLLKNKIRSLKKMDYFIFIITLGIAGIVLIFIAAWLSMFLLFGSMAVIIRSPNKRLLIMLLAFLIMSGNVVVTYQYAHVKCANELNNYINKGDTIALDGLSDDKYDFYSYINERDIKVINYNASVIADFLISDKNSTYANFEKIGEYRTTYSPTPIQKLWSLIRGKDISDIQIGDIMTLWRRT